MNWRSEWSGLSARIRGAVEAAEVYFQARGGNNGDEYSVVKHCLLPQTGEIYHAVERFAHAHSNSFPPNAVDCIAGFIRTRSDVFTSSNLLPNAAILFRVTALAAFRSEFDHHIADSAAFARRLSDRAFVHIQRSIVVDDDERARWISAFKNGGETSCERLGSVRLLSHGIWAFKVDAVGERTDLVFQEPLQTAAEIQRSADALVLTEWKLCPQQIDLASKLDEAKAQAQRYRAGALAAIELTSYRYLVMVSLKHLSLPSDELVDGVLYRHVNIAVDPNTPSTDSRAQASSKSRTKSAA